MSRTKALALLLALSIVLAACGSGSDTDPGDDAAEPATTTTPTTNGGEAPPAEPKVVPDDELYTPPSPLPEGEPGDVIQMTAPVALEGGGTEQRILYRSTTTAGEPTAVSAVLFVPDDVADDAPVLSMAHGTIGLADCAAPSRDHESKEAEIAYFSGLAKEGLPDSQFASGAIVVASDFEGLGTPGVHTYLVGRSEGANVLDAIRAARQVTGTSGPSLTIGHSQGGGAALWAAQMAPEYAPDVDLVGAVAAAPAMELPRMAPLIEGDNLGFLPMLVAGFAAAYPEVDPADYLTPKGLEAIEQMSTACDDTFEQIGGAPKDDYFTADIAAVEPLATLLEENSPGGEATDVPILLVHGEADEVVPFEGTAWFLDRTCETGGVTVDFRAYPGALHHDLLVAAHPDITAFLADRLAGKPPMATPCP